MKTFFTFLSFCFFNLLQAQSYKMLVGTYNTDTIKNGIYLYDFNKKTGASNLLTNIPLSNPSFLTVAPKSKNIYAVLENGAKTGYSGSIAALQYNKKTNAFTLQNTVSTMGNNPCHIATDATGNYVVATNYSSGNFCSYSTNKDGSLNKLIQNIQHKGGGKDTGRQKSAHAHGAFFNKENTELYITDLGIDKVMCYKFDATNGSTKPAEFPYLELKPGSGPRHLAIHPNGQYMYILEELTAKITEYYRYNDYWQLLGSVYAEPPMYTGKSSGAAIIISSDGKFLYVSNRGTSNTIAIYKIDGKNGAIDLVGHQSSNGLKPRNMNFDPTNNFLLVANQDSNTIVVFKRDPKTGLLQDTNQNINVPKPVCITWMED
jgi:6-phosphogluconolactonase